MNIPHVALVFLYCVCVCDISDTVRIVANQTTQNPGNCILSMCPSAVCTRVLYSEKDSTCIYLNCNNDTECDLFAAELGRKAQKEQRLKNRAAPLQHSPPPIVPLTASAAPSPATLPLSEPEGNQSFNSRNSNSSTQTGDLEQIQNNTLQHESQGQILNNPLQNGHQRQPSIQPFTPAPPSPPVSVASVRAGNIPVSQNRTRVNKTEQETTTTTNTSSTTSPALPTNSTSSTTTSPALPTNSTSSTTTTSPALPTNSTSSTTTTSPALPTNSTSSTTITTTISQALPTNSTSSTTTISPALPTNFSTTTTSPALPTNSTITTTTSPALPTNSTTATNIIITMTTVTAKTTGTTRGVTSPPNTTTTLLTSTPPPSPPSSRTPAVLPSVTPSTPPPGQHAPTAPPRVPDVTSDQGKGMEEAAGGELTSRFINTNSLIAVLIFGLLFFIVTVVLFLRHAYESYKRRGYTQMDYLINGMYSDSGL